MNVSAATAADRWSQGQGSGPGLSHLSLVQGGKANGPGGGDEFIRLLVDELIRPLYEAAPADRWSTLQDILVERLDSVFQTVPSRPPEESDASDDDPPDGVERLIQVLINDEPGDSPLIEVLEDGRQYHRDRADILEKRPELDDLKGASEFVISRAGASHTAAKAFVLTIIILYLEELLTRQEGLSDDDFWMFIGRTLRRASEDQYVLLRSAELDLLDDEQENTIVVPGEMTDEAREMEEQAHAAWLEIRK